jgi:DNA-binding transcriptional ArsR family regulator
VFRAVADPTRRALLDLLLRREHSVNELRVRFRMSQPAISQHLRVLRRAGLVRARREGRRRMYRLEAKPIEDVYRWAAAYRVFFDPQGHAWAFREVKKQE